jgi:hypothetical protein
VVAEKSILQTDIPTKGEKEGGGQVLARFSSLILLSNRKTKEETSQFFGISATMNLEIWKQEDFGKQVFSFVDSALERIL